MQQTCLKVNFDPKIALEILTKERIFLKIALKSPGDLATVHTNTPHYCTVHVVLNTADRSSSVHKSMQVLTRGGYLKGTYSLVDPKDK